MASDQENWDWPFTMVGGKAAKRLYTYRKLVEKEMKVGSRWKVVNKSWRFGSKLENELKVGTRLKVVRKGSVYRNPLFKILTGSHAGEELAFNSSFALDIEKL